MAGHADQPGQLPVGRDPSCGNLCDDAQISASKSAGIFIACFCLSETAGAESGAQVRPLPPESRFLDGPGHGFSAAAHPTLLSLLPLKGLLSS